jgi:pimeloyl-ACP methyl ester carboxylesterase
VDLPPGVRQHSTQTSRLLTSWLESGPEDGVPVVLVHGNLSTGRFYEQILPGAPERFRFVVPDMRGFGRSEKADLDATRGLRDWSDDVRALLDTIGVTEPVHLAGWSTGGAAVAHYATDHGGVASLTFIDPVSPYGFGAVHPDGRPAFPDYAGSGGGTGSPDFVAKLREGDRSADSPFSPRTVLRTSYVNPAFQLDPALEDLLVDEILLSLIGDGGYPGDLTTSENWPGVAPGTKGILNALSPKYCNWSGIVDLDPKPPVLWTHGEADIVIADSSAWEIGTLGAAGHVPGWPGMDVVPPQPMVTQIRDVLQRYADGGGRVRAEMMPGAGHGPLFDAKDAWCALFFEHLESAAG